MLLSKEELTRLSEIDPSIADFVKKNPRPEVNLSGHDTMREGMRKAEIAFNNGAINPVPAEVEQYHEIPMRDGFVSTMKIAKPLDAPSGPLIVLLFGGGFVSGTIEQFTRTARGLVKLFRATVVTLGYRVGPEHKFPISQYDVWDGMKWVADNATGSLLHSDPTRGFILGGVSAGGGMTASFSRIFQEQPLAYPLTAQWLCIASICDSTCIPEGYEEYYLSASTFADGAFFSKKTRDALKSWVQWDSASPLRYCVHAKSPLSGQPKTYFQVDGMDPLRDDSLIYDDMLQKAGVETKIDVYPGCPHGHFLGFVGLEITDRANIDTMVGFGWLLGTNVSRDDATKAMGL